MASIKPIESLSVHRIQSGQVIVDLCSVVKELLENSIDAGATQVEVRFKNQGLDAIEVADNGSGISKDDYETVALKHYTSKLRTYDDLEQLDTFGFRGEAISSLCAVSDVHIITAQEHEAPKATRLNFTQSGVLGETSLVAGTKGTTVFVETIFKNLPVRRQELTKNIKREYTKVLNLLQAYACISTSARLSVSNVAAKGKKTVVFATKARQSTRENIANVFGTKTTASLIPLDLSFQMQASTYNAKSSEVRVTGHVSMPTVGEGRQMADRQMFFVNGRPCALPQVGKAMNEVYKSYNLTQSPFIFANLELDTNAYDVNVSPDKRTILLHEQGALLESMRAALLELFESHQQSVPQAAQSQILQPSAFKQPALVRKSRVSESPNQRADEDQGADDSSLLSKFAQGAKSPIGDPPGLVQKLFTNRTKEQDSITRDAAPDSMENEAAVSADGTRGMTSEGEARLPDGSDNEGLFVPLESTQQQVEPSLEEAIPAVQTAVPKPSPGSVPSAFDRMRPMRAPLQQATITIGDQTTTKTIGGPSSLRWGLGASGTRSKAKTRTVRQKSGRPSFQSALQAFAAPGTQQNDEEEEADETGGESDEESDVMQGVSALPKPNLSNASPSVNLLQNRDSHLDGDDDDISQSSASERSSAESDKETEERDDENDDSDHDMESDEDYINEETKKAKEDARVAELIHRAEVKAAKPTKDGIKRAIRILKGPRQEKATTLQLSISDSADSIVNRARAYESAIADEGGDRASQTKKKPELSLSAEERLSLTVSKEDFQSMRIAGQFNLGFVIATRPAVKGDKSRGSDELFIIDQHASDEKYNFERLQATTIVQNQRLVHHQRLDLTAVEEEIVMENRDTLLANGFDVEINDSGEYPVGKRCTLVSLPMSKEVTFSTRDLEELIALLGENPVSQTELQTQSSISLPAPIAQNPKRPADSFAGDDEDAAPSSRPVPSLTRDKSSFMATTTTVRPSRVRKMFAMRACRSSIMIGRTLTQKQMRGLVDNMGKMDKPWNCPHGRPTMRHLFSFGGGGGDSSWQAWTEVDGVSSLNDGKEGRGSAGRQGGKIDWSSWLAEKPSTDGSEDEAEGDEGDEGDEGGQDEGSMGIGDDDYESEEAG